MTIIYKIYTNFIEGNANNKTSLLIGAIVDKKTGEDALEKCIKLDKNFVVKVQILYNSTRDNKPLLKNVVRPLSKEGILSISELKKDAIRLSFFVDSNILFHGIMVDKAIVFLSYFPKRDKKSTQREIIKAQKLRDKFLFAKENGLLEKVDVYYE